MGNEFHLQSLDCCMQISQWWFSIGLLSMWSHKLETTQGSSHRVGHSYAEGKVPKYVHVICGLFQIWTCHLIRLHNQLAGHMFLVIYNHSIHATTS